MSCVFHGSTIAIQHHPTTKLNCKWTLVPCNTLTRLLTNIHHTHLEIRLKAMVLDPWWIFLIEPMDITTLPMVKAPQWLLMYSNKKVPLTPLMATPPSVTHATQQPPCCITQIKMISSWSSPLMLASFHLWEPGVVPNFSIKELWHQDLEILRWRSLHNMLASVGVELHTWCIFGPHQFGLSTLAGWHMSKATHPSTHSLIPCIPPQMLSGIHPSIHAITITSMQSSFYPCIHPSRHPHTYAHINSYLNASMHPYYLPINYSIHPSLHSPLTPTIHPSIQLSYPPIHPITPCIYTFTHALTITNPPMLTLGFFHPHP